MENRLQNAPCGLLSLDHEGYLLEVNDTFLKEMSYERETILNKHIECMCKPSMKMIFHSYFYPNINLYGSVKEFFIKLKNQAGEEVPFIMSANQYIKEGKDQIDVVLLPMRRRVEYEKELKQTQRELQEALKKLEDVYAEIQHKQETLAAINTDLVLLTNTDHLTGIANRKFLQERLEGLIERYQEEGIGFSLLLMDIDHFKQVNDCYGHQVGDEVLIKVASLLKEYAGDDYVAGRFGGEEFILLLPGADESAAFFIAKKVNRLIEKATFDQVNHLTISIGSATFTKEDDLNSILRKADYALYVSKEKGRNRATHYSEAL
ncbi:sensor domain-containing diguanylate cyclase [Jeotgalibaca caeni]|uniref:sensor domain-containing diguanylate cyclase n=1 Tax=Jeotgalibaca caeni TaxID=3028623 RepID=UPI00237E16DC|nr:sensor domain-containing diguanylate cyclase [Jeotgalibaca caeni]MDE1548903.1 sensor domain-containing diguanylate cyclase [Jeotgalibaca caeni]